MVPSPCLHLSSDRSCGSIAKANEVLSGRTMNQTHDAPSPDWVPGFRRKQKYQSFYLPRVSRNPFSNAKATAVLL
jgi:hypothetical protein